MAGRKRRPGTPSAASHATTPARVGAIDTLRGIAILAMIAYHFAFDLRYFGVIRADFENGAFWLAARAAIVSAFLLLVGISLVLASRNAVPAARFLRRMAVVAACALLASAGSWFVYPRTFIYFGILHCIVVASLIARPLAHRPRVALVAGCAIILAGLALSHPVFDTRMTSWIGFTTVKPPTQDFVPLAPWLGVVLLGIAAGNALYERGFAVLASLARAPRALRWMGRHSLPIYMVHQPVMMGLMWLLMKR